MNCTNSVARDPVQGLGAAAAVLGSKLSLFSNSSYRYSLCGFISIFGVPNPKEFGLHPARSGERARGPVELACLESRRNMYTCTDPVLNLRHFLLLIDSLGLPEPLKLAKRESFPTRLFSSMYPFRSL